jgi:hypothetical protein
MSTSKRDVPEYDAGDRRHVERRGRVRRRHDRLLDDAFKWLMGDARGRMLMWQRLAEAGVFRSSLGATPELTAFHEGRRDMGLRDLGNIMRLCPEQYMRMTAESVASDVAVQASAFDTPNGDKE